MSQMLSCPNLEHEILELDVLVSIEDVQLHIQMNVWYLALIQKLEKFKFQILNMFLN
jgi:hypothetical protein